MARLARKKILIVEDERAILKAVAQTFAAEDFEVIAAKDGAEGLTQALEHRPDLIILDIVMPVMDGLSMLRNIRANGGAWGKKAKVIVYTNLSYNEKREEASHVGVADFLIKANVPLEELVSRVKSEFNPAAIKPENALNSRERLRSAKKLKSG